MRFRLFRKSVFCKLFVLFGGIVLGEFPSDYIERINLTFSQRESEISIALEKSPNLIKHWSNRGDVRLFLGDFHGARKDYEKMIDLDPKIEVSHWRLGIAYFYLKQFDKAARQFEIYHNYDAVDRENGIWRFMSQFKSKGLKTARDELLKYKKDDRPPYPLLYEMFAGRLEPDAVLSKINEQSFPEHYRIQVLFHAHLYVGIYLQMVKDNKVQAEELLKKAFENQYGRRTGTYMWQVARLHYFQMLKSRKDTVQTDTKNGE